MSLYCPECSEKINPEDINVQRMIAVCDTCGHLFRFDDHFQAESSDADALPIPQPSQITVHNEINKLIIEWRWWNIRSRLWLILSLLISGWFLAGLVPLFLEFLAGDIDSLITILILPHTWLLLIVLYNSLTSAFNKTTFIVDEFSFKMKHGPLPWLGNRTLNREDIVQIFTKEVPGSKKGSRRFHLSAVLANGKDLKIISAGSNANLSAYIEQELENFMGIRDKKVKGEYDPINSPMPSFEEMAEEFRKKYKKD